MSDEDIEKTLVATSLQRDKAQFAYEKTIHASLTYTGVRASELLDMRLSHIYIDAGTLIIPHGEGDKARTLCPPQEWLDAVRQWVALPPKRNRVKC